MTPNNPIQQFLADPQLFFTDPQNYVYAYALIIFVTFTVGRFSRAGRRVIPLIGVALLFLLSLLRSGALNLSWPVIFFALLVIVALVVGIQYLQRLRL